MTVDLGSVCVLRLKRGEEEGLRMLPMCSLFVAQTAPMAGLEVLYTLSI